MENYFLLIIGFLWISCHGYLCSYFSTFNFLYFLKLKVRRVDEKAPVKKLQWLVSCLWIKPSFSWNLTINLKRISWEIAYIKRDEQIGNVEYLLVMSSNVISEEIFVPIIISIWSI